MPSDYATIVVSGSTKHHYRKTCSTYLATILQTCVDRPKEIYMEVVEPQTLGDHRHVELGRRLVLGLERRQAANHVDGGGSPEVAEHNGVPVSKQLLVPRNVSPNVVKKLLARVVYRSQHSIRVGTVTTATWPLTCHDSRLRADVQCRQRGKSPKAASGYSVS